MIDFLMSRLHGLPHSLQESIQRRTLLKVISGLNNFDSDSVRKIAIASDKGGSGNTANIGSITHIEDIIEGKGMFSKLGEKWFDDYYSLELEDFEVDSKFFRKGNFSRI